MEKLITLFLTLGLAQSLQSANLEDRLNLDYQIPFDFEQIEEDSKLIKDWEDRNRYRIFNNPKPLPTKQQIRYSWIIHTLDVASTIYALENRDNVKEGNPILGEQPESWEVIGLKLTVLPFVHQNSNEYAMTYFNTITTAVVLNNLRVIYKYE